MMRVSPEQGLLSLWAMLAGFALWVPAWSVPGLPLPLQPMDILVVIGWPLLAAFARPLIAHAPLVLIPCLISFALSWAAMGGEVLILIWTLFFAVPFVGLMTLVFGNETARKMLLKGLAVGAVFSLILFLAQIIFGAEGLDFRTNIAFRLPPHYGRGFAIFPEVSTFASHCGIAAAMAVALMMHPGSGAARRRRWAVMLAFCGLALLFSRSSSVLVLVPILLTVAIAVTTRLTWNTLLLAGVLAIVLSLFLALFLQSFYAERMAESSATRSASMRLASLLGGLSPLSSGELFGVGLGENALVRVRAHEAARAWGLRFGNLPNGVNSHVVARIFEEGWPAVIQMVAAGWMLLRARHCARESPERAALYVLAVGSLLSASVVTGYRGIYTNWIWLAGAAAWAPALRNRPREKRRRRWVEA